VGNSKRDASPPETASKARWINGIRSREAAERVRLRGFFMGGSSFIKCLSLHKTPNKGKILQSFQKKYSIKINFVKMPKKTS
jgi:hypothetical protein